MHEIYFIVIFIVIYNKIEQITKILFDKSII